MTTFRSRLPQLDDVLFLTDGGMETTLIFHDGVELPHFAAFDLLRDREGAERLRLYYRRYADLAQRLGYGFILESPTWRANADWGAKLGYTPEALAVINREAIALLVEERERFGPGAGPCVISGCIGPRGDGYVAGRAMSPAEAEAYHAVQVATFRATEADMVSAFTMTNVPEAIGIVRAARAADMPVVISFTVETDGRLPSGDALGEAIAAVDGETGAAPAYYMINCAHPTHFADVLGGGGAWTSRLRGLRANASKCSHAELDAATELDDGDPADLGWRYRDLRGRHPHITILGGCCGTDHRHVEAIGEACRALAA